MGLYMLNLLNEMLELIYKGFFSKLQNNFIKVRGYIMLDIKLKYKDIEIVNIEKENIEDIFI